MAHAADAIGALTALDGAGRNRGMPAIVAVEITQHRPDLVSWGVDDRALNHVRHA